MTVHYDPSDQAASEWDEEPDVAGGRAASLGDTVLYTLTGRDADAINRLRQEADHTGLKHAGAQMHRGTTVRSGQQFPAFVVQRSPNGELVNVKVELDGNDTHWVAAVRYGRKPGEWTHLRRSR